MANETTSFKRIFTAAVTTVASKPQGVRGPLRGKDFMLDDQTSDADRDGQ
jgi:hypothetical protein